VLARYQLRPGIALLPNGIAEHTIFPPASPTGQRAEGPQNILQIRRFANITAQAPCSSSSASPSVIETPDTATGSLSIRQPQVADPIEHGSHFETLVHNLRYRTHCADQRRSASKGLSDARNSSYDHCGNRRHQPQAGINNQTRQPADKIAARYRVPDYSIGPSGRR
jgi:hypothetical protein